MTHISSLSTPGNPSVALFRFIRPILMLLTGLIPVTLVVADGDLPTEFDNNTTIGNTRHNMTQRQTAGGGPNGSLMDPYRKDYVEICVYCHTPHGANSTTSAPLWNRTMRVTAYTTYSSATISGTVTQPGAASLACLSCHDGQTAVDSIINMPGSGRYDADQETTQDNLFLNTWTNTRGTNANGHRALSETGCLVCHSPDGLVPENATDFRAAVIGTDLTNDHPVGVTLPTGSDWNVPGGTQGASQFFDVNGNNRMDKGEIRFYNSGDGNEVECASCHDPHGVPSAGAGSQFNLTFLRISNTGSAVCLTCHNK